ncbi:ATP-binding protein [Streptomyces sp. NBC_00648]|uniref:HD domain-containing protein n=1 Tax=Streptomyces sp. NBC_00648 TaxID=2975797 RepID=UPI00324E2831
MKHNESARSNIRTRALGSDAFTDAAEVRERFSRSLTDMATRANQLALEIGSDLPEFTRHDEVHFDALWELADLIAGPDAEINPAEAFVLGGAILVHDLAMSRAAHHIAGGELRGRPEWPDTLASELRTYLGRPPHPSELVSPPEKAAKAAEKFLLRSLHAEIAAQLPLSSWQSLSGDRVYMVSDPEIRTAYGRLVGAIAASHHWDIDEVVTKFSAPVGVPGFAPVTWSVDALRLACLLRVTDATHLDSSRAPDLLAAVRNLPHNSADHWLFQSRLQRPYIRNGRLVFTAPDGFSREEMEAWWLAYETLKCVDSELKGADAVLTEKGRESFLVRGVAHVDTPREFSSVVPCRDWEPVEARVKVGDVASLVKRLGGTSLYGANPSIGLREILSNACDAVKARESLVRYRTGRAFAGRVTVWVEENPLGQWVVCSDNGVGMTSDVLANKLLDFGCSSWLSPEAVRGNTGLIASQFAPTGKFGIGFFSVFMMGSRVQVWSRPLSGAPSDTWLLEFSSGVGVRPTLRRAQAHEEMDEPGTTVKVLLDEGVADEEEGVVGIRGSIRSASTEMDSYFPLSHLILATFAAPQADIWVSDRCPDHEPSLLIQKNDWVTMDGAALLRRVSGLCGSEHSQEKDIDHWALAEEFGPKLQLIRDSNGTPLARLCMVDRDISASRYRQPIMSTVTAGPATTRSSLSSGFGIIIGSPSKAARNSANPLLGLDEVSSWATREAVRIFSKMAKPGEWSQRLGEDIIGLGGDPGDLPIWRLGNCWINYDQLVAWIAGRDEMVFVDPVYVTSRAGSRDHPVSVKDDILAFETGYRPTIFDSDGLRRFREREKFSCLSVFGKAVEEGWGNGYGDALDEAVRHGINMIIGMDEGRGVYANAHRLLRHTDV